MFIRNMKVENSFLPGCGKNSSLRVIPEETMLNVINNKAAFSLMDKDASVRIPNTSRWHTPSKLICGGIFTKDILFLHYNHFIFFQSK
jgi:hypothetical protein